MKRLVLFGSVAVLLAGCIPSINPFYTEKDLVFEPKLLGEWQAKNDEDQPEQWRFEKREDKAYKLTVTEEKTKTGEFSAHLFKLGPEYFLDLVPSKCDYAATQAFLVGCAMFPGHLLVRVAQFEPELKLAAFDFDWLKGYLEEHPNALAHYQESDVMILTATTADLQHFALAHLAPGQLFAKAGALARKETAPR
jgi:hypothetical protein